MSIIVINLDRDQSRLESFLTLNAHLPDMVRFSAIDGDTADRAALKSRGIISANMTYNNGQLGTALSHLTLWRQAVMTRAIMTIMEDDAICARNFQPAHTAFLARLPDGWDIVLWGWNFDSPVWAEIPEGVAAARLHFDQNALRRHIDVFRQQEVAHTPIRLHHALGTTSYTISPSGARILLDICLPLEKRTIVLQDYGLNLSDSGIDCVMNAAYRKMKAYMCVPPLAVSENRHETSHTRRKP